MRLELPIRNTDRSTGAMLSGEIARRYGHAGLRDEAIHVKFKGTAGQSFGAFLAKGVTLELEGEANDYVGKGLSGGRIVVYPPEARRRSSTPEKSIIVGNTVLYGAIAGECYFRGVAGERFGVRNSGALAVVEGAGDHGCEYMTGGIVVVIGETGRNFAAGMSGGIAYVLDEAGDFAQRCNLAMVELEPVASEEEAMQRHHHSGGDLARPRPRRRHERHEPLRRRAPAPADRQPRALHRLDAGARDPRELGGLPAEVPQGDAGRIPPRARRAGGAEQRADAGGGGMQETRRPRPARWRSGFDEGNGGAMGKVTGFLEIDRADRRYARRSDRIRHYREFVLPLSEEATRNQAARCMNCGIPYCHNGCPVNNQIPDWNDLVYRGDWQRGVAQPALHQQFPRIHRPRLPGAVRGLLHAQPPGLAGDDQDDRMRDRRPRLARGLAQARAAGAPHRQARRRRRLRPGGPRLRPAARARRP